LLQGNKEVEIRKEEKKRRRKIIVRRPKDAEATGEQK
jgi:hypothetical protein